MMVQAINTKAILTLSSIIRRPNLVIPHVSVNNISEIDFQTMKEKMNICGIIFDKDNTLTSPYEYTIHPNAVFGIQNAQNVFGNNNIAILSNSAGTITDDPNYIQAKKIEDTIGISVIRHEEKKPGGIDECLKHFQFQYPSSSLCIIGDRILTDIVFGNLHGMFSIHTKPLCIGRKENSNDNITAKIIRPIENYCLYRNWFGKRWLNKKQKQKQYKYWKTESEISPLLLTTIKKPPPAVS